MVSGITAEISKYCSCLTSERPSERKSSINKLLDRLKDGEVQRVIDENCVLRQKKKITWDFIAIAVFSYVSIEADILKNATKLAEDTILRRKNEICEAFRSFIQVAEKRGPNLKSDHVYHHIWEIICGEKTREWFCNEYTSSLLKNFLSVKVHMNEVTPKIWQNLVGVYIDCLRQPPRRADIALFGQTFNQLMVISKDLPFINSKKLHKFFKDMFKNLRQVKSESSVEYILSSLNNFCLTVAHDRRAQLCDLGEEIFQLILPFWNKSSSSVKDEMIKFFQLQIKIHNPNGAQYEEIGACSSSESFWKQCLLKLQDAIINEFQQLAGKIQRAGSRADPQKESFINLAVETFYQVLQIKGNPHSASSQITNGGSCRKKRKTDSVWSAIRDGLSRVTHPTACIAWLQLFTSFIKKYPKSVPSQEYFPILNCLYQCGIACKKLDVKVFIVRALCALADRSRLMTGWETADKNTKKDMLICWNNIWLNNLKNVHSNNSDDSGFLLLISLIKNEIVIPKEDPFAIFYAVHSKISWESLQFLLLLMQKFTIPAEISHGATICRFLEPKAKYQTRQHLIQLVFPNIDFSSENKSLAKALSNITSNTLKTLGHVINGLLHKNVLLPSTELASIFHQSGFSEIEDLKSNETKELEQLYLLSSFNKISHKEEKTESCLINRSNHLCSGPIDEICDYLCEAISEATIGAIGLLENEEYMRTSNSHSDWLLLSTKYTALFCQLVLSHPNDDDSPMKLREIIMKSISDLLYVISTFINKFFKNQNIEQDQRIKAILVMVEYLDKALDKRSAKESMAQVLNSFPKRLLEFLLSIVTDGIVKKSAFSDEMDIDDFGSYESGSTVFNEFDDLIDSTNQIIPTQNRCAKATHSTGSQDRLRSQQPISDADKLRVSSAKFILKFAFPTRGVADLLTRKSSIFKDPLLDFLDRTFESTSYVHCTLLSVIVDHLGSITDTLCLFDLELIFELVRKFISTLRSDQQACAKGLHLLCKLMPYLKSSADFTDSQLSHVRCITKKILSAFWNLRQEKYSPKVRMMLIDCFVNLFQIDPKNEWSGLESVKTSKRSNTEEIQNIPDLLLQMLSDPSHQVRMKAASHVMILFSSAANLDEADSPAQQLKAFDKVANALTDLIILKDSLSEEESMEDVNANLASTLLLVIKQIAVSSKLCEKKALALLFHDYKEKFLNIKLVGKVFRVISEENGYSDARRYLKEHLGYLCNDWMKRCFPITKFPSSVVQMDIKEFLQYYNREIIPYLMLYRDENSFDQVKQILKLEDPWNDLLMDNFDRIVVFSLPYYACQSKRILQGHEDETEREHKTRQAKLAYEFLEKKLTREAIEKLLVEKFDEIVTELLFRMYDPPLEDSDASQFMRESDTPPNPPFFTSYAIKGTLEYLAKCYQNKSVISVLSKNKDSIQKILLSLSTTVSNSRNDRERVRHLCSYRFFIFLLLEDQSSLNSNRAFFIRDVIHRCCHWLNKEIYKSPDDSGFACVYQVLHQVSETSMNTSYKEFGCHISEIVNCLTKYAKVDNDRGKKALQLLRLIVLNGNHVYRNVIAELAPMPDLPQFSTMTSKIIEIKAEDETNDRFEDFLRLCQFDSMSDEIWDYFYEMIRNEKQYLKGYIEINPNGSSIILGILSRMLQIASNANVNQNTRNTKIAIGKCLGEIGPIDCHALAMPLASTYAGEDPDDKSFFGSNEVSYRHHLVLDRLCRLQTNENIEVAASASRALRDALHTKTGIQHLSLFDIAHDSKPKFFLYSEPFKATKTKKGFQQSQRSQKLSKPTPSEFLGFAGGENFWCPGIMKFESWLKELTTTIISSGAVEDEIFLMTSPVCQLNVDYAKLMLPLLIHNILENCSADFSMMLSSLFNRFLSSYLTRGCKQPHDYTKNHDEKWQNSDKEKSARSLIEVIIYLRKQDKPSKAKSSQATKWENNFWLDIKYLELAQVAFDCSSYFAAVMFTEIWCDIQRYNLGRDSEQDSLSSSQGSQWEAISNHSGDSVEKASCQRLLFEAYMNIGEPDGIYGVDTGCSDDVSTRIKAYEHEKEFGKALLTQDFDSHSEDYSSQLHLAKNLERSGLHQIMLTYTQGLGQNHLENSTEFEELRYEAAWRNRIWDLETTSRSTYQEKTGLSKSIYSSILALKDGNEKQFEFLIDEARLVVLSDDKINGNVSTMYLYQFLSKLHAISELESYGKQCFSKALDWDTNDITLDNEFQYYELALSVKAAAMKATLAKEIARENSLKDELAKAAYHQLLHSATLAREAKKYQICERQLSEIRQMESIALMPSEWKIEQAKMFWDRGETNRAMHHLKSLIRVCEKGKSRSALDYYPAALGLYGHWMAESRSENPAVIIENYMEHAACLLEDSQCTETKSPTEAYSVLAKYADSQYKGIQEYIKSSTFENKQSVIKKVKEEIDRLEEMDKSGGSTSSRYYRRLVAQRDEDENELQQMVKDRKKFLQKALENYVRCLCGGDNYDLHVFRLCSLWLENSHESFVNEIMKDCISKMQSRKFIPLMYQLAARMGTVNNLENVQFKTNLEKLIEKVAKEHPYHVMFIIMALCNVEEEANEQSNSTARKSKMSRKSSQTKKNGKSESRVQSAKAVLARLQNSKAALMKSMVVVMEAYIELAYYDIQHLKRQSGKFDLPSKLRLRSLKDLQNVAIPTMDIPVDPSCQYKRITYISGFDPKFTHCGGINLPKVITCIGSDGKRRRQLVKGRDDLRQDAVMQQVFEMVNKLLKENPETRTRELRIRTYKVVPLSQRSGIVEWCENTVPLGEYLVGNRGQGGAHPRYHPTDWTAMECRKKLTDATLTDGKKSKYNVFQEIIRNFRPVFRHFFYEKFTEPDDWFTRRLAYTRSLASSSIVGYVVGLGDRHVQNILVDFNTAELVHIDLGVAFEQGKQLPTPETIPFRLTRDLVDGLGVAGVEGIFRRCCEKTMEVMRNSQESILTIVEVLLYDPLYEWTLSPLKAVQLQQKSTETDISDTLTNTSITGTDVNINNLLEELQSVQPQQNHSKNKMAQRVLVRLKQKLDGNEGGSFLSNQGQVNFLIQAARDVKNLCRVFPGWQPWL